MTYSELSIEDKFRVVKRYIDHRTTIAVRKALGKKVWFEWEDIDTFFAKGCQDMQPGSKTWALMRATKCFYCETSFCDPSSPEYHISRDRRTIDHFFSSKHSQGKNRLVISCDSCNNWKGHMHPEVVIKRIRRLQVPKHIRMNETTALKIERILMDFKNDVGPKCYYI